LLPGAEIQFARSDGYDNFASHNLSLDMRVGIVFARIVVTILAYGFVRRHLFQPLCVVFMQSAFVIVNEHRCRNVHGIYQHQPFFDSAFPQAFFYLRRDIYEGNTTRCLKPQFFPETFHNSFTMTL